jgi:hypothetical protein
MTSTLPRPSRLLMPRKVSIPAEQPEEKKQQTTVRAYTHTAKKLNQLAILKDMAVHDLIDELFTELLDNELIVATETRLADLKKKQQGR